MNHRLPTTIIALLIPIILLIAVFANPWFAIVATFAGTGILVVLQVFIVLMSDEEVEDTINSVSLPTDETI